jgi:hypothetical protein
VQGNPSSAPSRAATADECLRIIAHGPIAERPVDAECERRQKAGEDSRDCGCVISSLFPPYKYPLREALSLEWLVMAAISICVGIVCATRFRVAVIVVISAMALVAAAFATVFSDSWNAVIWIIEMMILMQAGYLASAMIQSFLHKR